MEVSVFDKSNNNYINEAAELLEEIFDCYKGRGKEQMKEYLGEERIALMAVENNYLIGRLSKTPFLANAKRGSL